MTNDHPPKPIHLRILLKLYMFLNETFLPLPPALVGQDIYLVNPRPGNPGGGKAAAVRSTSPLLVGRITRPLVSNVAHVRNGSLGPKSPCWIQPLKQATSTTVNW